MKFSHFPVQPLRNPVKAVWLDGDHEVTARRYSDCVGSGCKGGLTREENEELHCEAGGGGADRVYRVDA
jgi:hypothetical protein